MAVMTPPPSACVYIPYLLHLPLGIPWFSCLTFLECLCRKRGLTRL